ncbi:MAG: hypothetical protein IT324_22805 [Anaerolineae bacterium]|nr:hypothetical protein [Anaerolineae bacterium]
MRQWIAAFGAALLALWWIGSGASYAGAQSNDNSAKIAAPQAGDSLFGLVTIAGTASNPNMQRYLLEFDSQEDSVDRWLPIAGPITQQVKDGTLAQWNTTAVPDGRYQIRLRVVLRDGTVLSDVIQNLRVSNKQPTPLPTVLPSATPLQPTLPPTAGPSPTPLIQQPPTNTPRPALPTLPPTAPSQPSPAPDSPQTVLALDALQNAFCGGVYLALIGFALAGGYSLIHRRLSPTVRRWRQNMRSNDRE